MQDMVPPQRAWMVRMASASRSGGMPVSEPAGLAGLPSASRIAPSMGQMLAHCCSA